MAAVQHQQHASSSWKSDMVQALHRRCSCIQADITAKVYIPGTQPNPTSPPNGKQRMSAAGTSLGLISQADFEIGRIIGAGSFGRVSVARHKATGNAYVIKSLSKSACIKDGQVRHVLDEKGMLARLSAANHPFLVNLQGTFQDSQTLNLVLDYVSGGEFFCYLRDYPTRNGCKMKEDHARFYAAQIVLALEHMHSKGIAFRDLKPENMLISTGGYIKVTDFGFAKEVAGATYTMCGTPDYLAPEVIKAQGHGVGVDWWALGCVIYEMLYGFPPFYGQGDPTQTYKNVLAHQLAFPLHWSDMVKDLVTGLLQVDVRKRLGCGSAGMAALKGHAWFQGLDWSLVLAKRYQPPYKPRVGAPDDTSNFDDYSKLPPQVHPFPLSPEQQHLFVCF